MDKTFKTYYYLLVLGVIFLIAGCPPPPPDMPGKLVKGKTDIKSAAEALNAHRDGVTAVKANGKLKYTYFKNGKPKVENPDAILRFEPPRNLFFTVRTALGEAMRVGSNDQEFWFLMKVNDISQFYSGTWDQLERCSSNLIISPESMLDAMGMVNVDESWTLTNEPNQDVLVKKGPNGKIYQIVFVSLKDYLPSRIEYYDNNGLVTAEVDISDYRVIPEASPVPSKIIITTYKPNTRNITGKIEITLKDPRFLGPEGIKPRTFVKPETNGFKDVFRMNDYCEFDKQ